MPRKQKDQIVGGRDADKPTSKALTTTSSPEVSPVYVLEDKIHGDIFAMYEAGVSPYNISRKYPVYSPEQVLELCASEYSLTHLDSDQVDAVLFRGMLRDLTRLDKYIRAQSDDPKLQLEGMKTLIDARERTIKYRQLLEPKLSSPDSPTSSPSAPLTWTIEQKLTTIIKSKPTHEAEKLIAQLEKASEQEIQEIINAEFHTVEEEQRLSDPDSPENSFTEERQLQHEEDLKEVIE